MDTFSFRDIKEQLSDWIQPDYIDPEDIPSIELYMDQVTTFMEQQLEGNKRYAEDKVLTKTMINNYSKNHLLPPSDKKKYSKEHIILLIYIYYLKNFLSISDIQQLLSPMSEQFFHSESGKNMEDIYRDLYQLEKNYGIRIKESIAEIYELADSHMPEGDNYLKTFAMIAMLSYDIYARKQIIEKLIDSFPPHKEKKADIKNTKSEIKEAKKMEKEKRKRQAD